MGDLPKLVRRRKREYADFAPVECLAMDGEEVIFAADGFYHCMHKGNRAPRNVADRWRRLNLLPYVREIVGAAGAVVVQERVGVERIDGKMKTVRTYRLEYELEKCGWVAVILRRIGENGKLRYYSVFPIEKPSKGDDLGAKKAE